MSSNGHHHPRRPRIEIASPVASPQEAATVVAAIERFLADTAPPPRPRKQVNRWLRAALLEGPRAKQAVADAWGEGRAWGAGG